MKGLQGPFEVVDPPEDLYIKGSQVNITRHKDMPICFVPHFSFMLSCDACVYFRGTEVRRGSVVPEE